MHELSLTQSLVEICTRHAKGQKVTKVIVEVGSLSGVVPESLEFCFDACSRETLLEGAKLQIEKVAASASCSECGSRFAVTTGYDPCPRCQHFPVSVLQGREFRVREIEVDALVGLGCDS